MRTRRWWIVLLVAVLAAAGCATTEEATDDEEPTGGEIEVAAVWTGDEQEAFQAVLDAFADETGIEVSYTSGGDDLPTLLQTRVEGGDPPEVAVLPQPGLMREFAGQGVLQPIEDVVGEAVDGSYAPIWRELGTVDDTLYGLFFKAANKSTVWYNVGAFSDAGVEAPDTWERLQATASTISDAGVVPYAFGGADGWTLTDWFENVYIRTAGPELYDRLATHEMPWTDESVATALETFAEVLDDPDQILEGDPTELDLVASVDAVFRDPPDAAIVYEGDFVPGVATVEATAEQDYDVFSFPSVDGSEPMVVGGGDVVVMFGDSPEAARLLEFLATPEAAEVWAALGGFASPNKDVDPSVYPDDIRRQTATAIAEASIFRFDLSDLAPAAFGATAGRGMWGILQEFAQDPSNVTGTQQALEEAAAAAYEDS